MTADPRAALTSLVAALERHLEVASSRRDPDDPAVVSAAEELTDAFFDYDEALFEATGVTAPIVGSRTVAQLRTALASEDLELPPEIVAALDEVSD